MKGEIFNLFEEFIVKNWGADVFEDIYEAVHANLHTKEPFVGPGTYPDSDFLLIVSSATQKVGVPLHEAVHAFGKFCLPKLVSKMPQYVENHSHPKTFLLTIHDIIHVEVRKVFKDATPPDFTYRDPAPNKLVMIYNSKRKLYDFVEGLLDGVSEYFEVPITYTRTVTSTNGAEVCEFELTFG